MRILVGEVSSYKAIVICRYLKRTYPSLEIFTYDHLKFTGTIHTRYSEKHIILPYNTIDSYLLEIANVVRLLRIDLFFPVHSNSIQRILEKRELFGTTLDYMGSVDDYCALHDKRKIMEIARKVVVPVPDEFSSISDATLPFVGKPPDKSSAKGVFYFRQPADLKKYPRERLNDYVYQEYISGKGCGYSVYARNGVIECGYGHLRLAEYPVTGGSSVYRQSFYLPEMRQIVEKILAEVKWTGFAMFEFKYTDGGKVVLIEVNPRIWGSINQGLQNGSNYFGSIIPLQPAMPTRRQREVRTYLGPQVYIALLKYVLKLNFKPLLFFIAGIKFNRADVSVFNDPKGWLSMLLRAVYR